MEDIGKNGEIVGDSGEEWEREEGGRGVGG